MSEHSRHVLTYLRGDAGDRYRPVGDPRSWSGFAACSLVGLLGLVIFIGALISTKVWPNGVLTGACITAIGGGQLVKLGWAKRRYHRSKGATRAS
jgi:hypothetical protein